MTDWYQRRETQVKSYGQQIGAKWDVLMISDIVTCIEYLQSQCLEKELTSMSENDFFELNLWNVYLQTDKYNDIISLNTRIHNAVRDTLHVMRKPIRTANAIMWASHFIRYYENNSRQHQN